MFALESSMILLGSHRRVALPRAALVQSPTDQARNQALSLFGHWFICATLGPRSGCNASVDVEARPAVGHKIANASLACARRALAREAIGALKQPPQASRKYHRVGSHWRARET